MRDVGRGKAWVGAGWTHVGGFVVFGWVRARGCALRVAIVRDAFRPIKRSFRRYFGQLRQQNPVGITYKRMTLKLCECEIITV